MSNRTYPRLGGRHPRRAKREAACDYCGRTIARGNAVFAVDLQWSYMRGDDDVAILCGPCNRGPIDVRHLAKKIAEKGKA